MPESLSEKLHKYPSEDIYPFHMPGHKRVPGELLNPYIIDITEINGFDDLHDAQGILKEEQDRAARLYGSMKCYYLVNGSTCGNLSAICAVTGRGGRVLVAHNCHRSVFHAMELMQLEPVYLYPKATGFGIEGQICVEDVERSLNEYTDIKAVIITSPTYDGVVSDIVKIAKAVHSKNIPLIVDEAHGAHLGFHEAFPENAVKQGADAVIMSLHKTLPSYTQTSLLHICSDRIDLKSVEHYLDVFETSSPSYILMDSISRCISFLEKPSLYDMFDDYVKKLEGFYKKTSGLSKLKIAGAEAFDKNEAFAFDIGKIIIYTANVMSGDELMQLLLNKYRLQLEKAGKTYALAMSSVMDTQEGFDRLADALIEIDGTF